VKFIYSKIAELRCSKNNMLYSMCQILWQLVESRWTYSSAKKSAIYWPSWYMKAKHSIMPIYVKTHDTYMINVYFIYVTLLPVWSIYDDMCNLI